MRVEHLTKSYGDRTALHDVTFSVAKGEVLGFLGPNGAGKTTTMRILTGYMPPTSGTAELAGYDVTRQSIEARRHLGYLPEHVPLYLDMTVEDYLDFVANLKGIRRKERADELDRVMSITHVDERADSIIGKLSKGFRQRVGLAQALLGDPDVLILDEPTVGLDPKQIHETRNLIKSLGGSHTVILSTHILPEVSMVCSRVVIINQGTIVAEDTPEALTARLRGAETIHLEVRGPHDNVARKLRSIPKVISVQPGTQSRERTVFTVACELGSDVREQLASTVVSSGWGLLELRSVGLSLEEIFLQLTTSEDAAA